MAFDWKKWLFAALKEAPKVVSVVETIHANKDTATKTELASTALVSAVSVAHDLDPADGDEIDEVQQASTGIIQAIQSKPITAKTATN